jgi:hypothetical protein
MKHIRMLKSEPVSVDPNVRAHYLEIFVANKAGKRTNNYHKGRWDNRAQC